MSGKAFKYIAFKRKKTGNCLSVLGFTSGEPQFKISNVAPPQWNYINTKEIYQI